MKIIITIFLLNIFISSAAKILIVGPNQSLKTIRQAILNARDNDTILLLPAVYKEGNLIVTKSITLIGKGAILDGENKYEILTVSGKNIVIKELEFRNSGYSSLNDYAALKIIDASSVYIEGNRFLNSYFSIHLNNSTNCVIRNNRIIGTPKSEQNTGNGIHLWKCNNILVEKNYITGHRDGIYFEFVTHSLIQKNISEKNIRYGLHFMYSNDDTYNNNVFQQNGSGVAVMYSKRVTMLNNEFKQNWGAASYGILLKEISDSRIAFNIFHKNTVAMHLEAASRMQVEKNIFSENGWALKGLASCDDNTFRYNNFLLNSFDVATSGTMVLNEFQNNYWDKYEGYDLNKDYVGDVPFHPVSIYSMIIEQNPSTLFLLRSFVVQLLDKAEKAMPSLTPENLVDRLPMIKPNRL